MTSKTVHETLSSLCNTWQLTNLTLLGQDSPRSNYVARAYSKIYQKNVVLKILLTNTHELEILKLYHGNGYVQLLDYNPEKNAFLLELVTPGISLKTFFPERDEEATSIVARMIKKSQAAEFLSPTQSRKSFKSFESIIQSLDLLDTFKSKKIPQQLLHKAQILSKKLVKNMPKLYLLHGDLHTENILLRQEQNSQEWIAIDPKGVIGPLEYEVGRFIMNPILELFKQENLHIIIQKRVEGLSKLLDLEKQNIIDWTFVQAILSACWCEEDGDLLFLDNFISFAQVIEKL